MLKLHQRKLLMRGSCAASQAWEHARRLHMRRFHSATRARHLGRNISNLGSCADISRTDSSVRSPLRRLLNRRHPELFTALFLAESEKPGLREVWNGARRPPVYSPYFARLPAAAEAPAAAAATGAAPLTTAALIAAAILTGAILTVPVEHVTSSSSPVEHFTSAASGATPDHVVRDVAVPIGRA